MKTKEQLLLDYRKTNKTKRLGIVQRAGFSTEAEYLAWLVAPDEVEDPSSSPAAAALFKKNEQPKLKIHNVHIVDISGSMRGERLESAIQGVNEEVEELKKEDNVEYTHSLVEFSGPTEINTVCWKVPMKDAPVYRTEVVGSTALNKALGETLERLVEESKLTPADKVLVKVFTDGGENASYGSPYKNALYLRNFITQCEEKGFTITFVGTKHDVQTVVNTLNIHASNTFTHDNTGATILRAAKARSLATKSYAAAALKGEDVTKGFYKSIK